MSARRHEPARREQRDRTRTAAAKRRTIERRQQRRARGKA